MPDHLLTLLRRIRDGHAEPSEVETARALVRDDPRLDGELRAVGLADEDDLAGDAAGLLAVLGADDLGPLLAEAIANEAAEATIDETHLETQPWTYGPDLVAAVTAEAGTVNVIQPILSDCSLTEPWSSDAVALATRAEAGFVDVTDAVIRACGLSEPQLPLADAVRAEAGTVRIANTVAPLGIDVVAAVRAAAGPIDISDAVMAKIRPMSAELAVPANDTRGFAALGLLLAAAVALFVSLAGIDTVPVEPLPALAFAHADEVVVEDLQSDTDVYVLQGEGQDGAFILWVDEET